jgi:hypothetical protein
MLEPAKGGLHIQIFPGSLPSCGQLNTRLKSFPVFSKPCLLNLAHHWIVTPVAMCLRLSQSSRWQRCSQSIITQPEGVCGAASITWNWLFELKRRCVLPASSWESWNCFKFVICHRGSAQILIVADRRLTIQCERRGSRQWASTYWSDRQDIEQGNGRTWSGCDMAQWYAMLFLERPARYCGSQTLSVSRMPLMV